MDIVRFKSGLGNQMFQYAFYQALRAQGRTVRASLGYYDNHPDKMKFCLDEVFPQIVLDQVSNEEFEIINAEWQRVKQDRKVLATFLADDRSRFFWVEERDAGYCPRVFNTQNCVFVGYWQSEKYFLNIRNILIKNFEFPYGEKQLEIMKKCLLADRQYVSVHVRRGDYLLHPGVWGNLSESEYYENAIRFMKKKIPKLQLVFFSDDISWVKERHCYKEAIYIEENMFDNYKPWYDLCLMSCCSNNIIANSSFSWWGAWLNRNEAKIVIAPRNWYYDGRVGKDICPEEWLRMGESG